MKKICWLMIFVCIVTFSAVGFEFPAKAPRALADESTALGKLYNMEIVDGFEDGQLHGEYNLTRAQFAKILCSVFPEAVTTEMEYVFSDFGAEHWAYHYVQKALNAGWLQGFGDGTFRPDDNITYEQALTVMCRALSIDPYGAQYPADYVGTAIEYSISDGVNALIGEVINREQAAQIIVNSLEYEDRQKVSDYSDGSVSKGYNGISYSGGGGSGAMMAPSAMSTQVSEEAVMDDGYAYYPPVEKPIAGMNTEEYSATAENVFKDTYTSPLSTFSIDTDTASYSNLRRFILNGQNIANGSVRSEELINYFDYTKAEIESDKPFGVNYTLAACPWNEANQLAMITVSGEELASPKPSNLVFLIDTSGSMYSYNKLPLVKQALSMLLDNLGENDRISIVTYASGTGVVLEPTPATEKERILEVISGLRAHGSTAGASGINLAYEQAEKYMTDGNNRIILCTDGDFNVGISSEGDLEKLISEKRESGIYLSVLGFGMGNYKDNKMETLADNGNGNYAYIDNLREAKKVLVDEMSKTIYTIAKDVKIQVEFNPAKVAKYRLIGYENRILNNEDFEDDTKDAGELGAGATVTVLYEIIPHSDEATHQLKYQTSTATGSDELMTVNIRYKEPSGSESILCEYPVDALPVDETGDDFRFAAAVAELGMILNDSPYKGTSTYESVIDLARSAIGKDPFGIRNEFVQLADLLRYRNY